MNKTKLDARRKISQKKNNVIRYALEVPYPDKWGRDVAMAKMKIKGNDRPRYHPQRVTNIRALAFDLLAGIYMEEE